MKLAFVVQRYGLDIAGGAEYHCRIVAEHLARHAQVEVLTTCAADYITWANRYPEGREVLNGIPVRRFKVKRPRDPERFADWTDRVLRAAGLNAGADAAYSRRAETGFIPAEARRALGGATSSSMKADAADNARAGAGFTPAEARGGLGGSMQAPPLDSARAGAGFTPAEARGGLGGAPLAPPSSMKDELRWLEEEGPLSPRLVRYVERNRDEYDFFVFFSYRYYTTYHGLRAVRDKALLVPTAEDDGVYRLSIFPPLFRIPRAVVYNSVEERAMIERVSANQGVPGEVVGVGSILPERLDPEGFRRKHRFEGRFVLYVGRIDENKGCRQLFDFFRRYRAHTGSSLRLALIGKPVLTIPQDPGIVHLGFLSDQDKWDALAASELLVMPSRLESLSMVTNEAWWAERPVLANAKCDVLRGQCLRSNAGLYYSSYDEFREALSLLESDQALRCALGRNGRRYFDAHYAWDVIEGKYLGLIARVGAENAALAASLGGAGRPPGGREP